MYFKDFNMQSIVATDNQRLFIIKLSVMLEHLCPPLIAEDKVKIAQETDRNGEYLKVSLPHKIKVDFDLWAAVYDIEVIVFFGDAHQHFYEDEWILDAVSFISKILQGKLEIHTFYKGNKQVKVEMYFINKNREMELISSCTYLNFPLFNPFLKEREEVVKISFFS